MSDVIAAVDLGSNSFHMVVARYSHGQLVIIDRLREMVRLAAGRRRRWPHRQGRRGARAWPVWSASASDCATSMRATCASSAPTRCASRAASRPFSSARARRSGFPIEIVSGMEEARLIYSGVAHNLPNESGRRLVVDIGGGSTEIIIGERYEPLELESLQMGCVSLSQRFFGDGRLSAKRIERARLAARLELEPIQAAFQRRGWERAVGSSGTVRVDRRQHSRARCRRASSITPEGLEQLLQKLADSGSLRELDLDAVSEERRPVFPGRHR